MSLVPIKKVVVAGGTGLTGSIIVSELVKAGFEVTILSRATSTAEDRTKTLSGFTVDTTQKAAAQGDALDAKIVKTDYSHQSLVLALIGQDAVVSCIQHFHLDKQYPIIDAAIEAGVRRFIPSEYGTDTSNPEIGKTIPQTILKQNVVKYLQSKEDTGLSWTGVIVGAYFDSCYDLPGVLGVDIPSKTLTVYDGGDDTFEATTMEQIGRGIAGILSGKNVAETANRYVYINSFTMSQNELFKIFQHASSNAFQIEHSQKEKVYQAAEKKRISDPEMGPVFRQGILESLSMVILNYRGFNDFSTRYGLWNDRLGLPKEDAEPIIEHVLASRGLLARG